MNYEYQVGGSLPPNAPSYVCRHADNDLYQSLKNGDFCYVLNSRQMGKSSLRVRTMQRLQQEGIACAAIDVTAIGNEGVTPDRWYAGILYELESNFNLSSNFRTWWREREMLSPIQRLSEFIEQVLLTEKTQQIVIFIDEIDSVLSLNFPLDDFFAFIRACYNKRADNFHYQRLTFGLFGVATPADLIQDKTRTPFNIGKAIELQGFHLSETYPLAEGLKRKAERPVEVLKSILAWTNGQPFLTQKLCKIILSSSGSIAAGTEIKIIEKLVKFQILDNWESLDNPEHLKTIRDRILRRGERASRLLGIYQEVLQEKEIIADNSVEQGELCLSGLVVKTGGKIKVYNAIYRAVFNASWVEQELANMRPYAESMTAWLASNCQDESRLLRGQALEAAQTWAAGKSLSDRDYQFLAASQELDKREVKKALAAEKEANQLLSTAQQKAQKRIRIGGIILAASLVGATLMTIWSGAAVKNANSRLKTAQDVTRLEREGMSVLQQFEAGNEQLPVLVSAMKTAQDLQKMVDSKVPVSDYPTTTPLLALQQILDKVTQRNEVHKISEHDIKFSPDGNLVAIKQINYLANKKQDDVVRILDNQGRQLFQVQEIPGDWEFSPDSQLIAISGQEGTVRIWNKAGKEILKLPGKGDVGRLKFSLTGKQLLTFTSVDWEQKVIYLWDLSGKKLAEIQTDEDNYMLAYYLSDIFSPDGQTFVTVTKNGSFNLWNLSGQKLTEATAHQNGIRTVKFSPSGQRFITEASAETTAKIWDISGRLIAELKGHNYAVTRIRVSSNGQRLMTTDSVDKIRLWDWSGQLIATLENPGEIASINFSLDGKLLVVATSQKVRLFDKNGKLVTELQAGGNSIEFSPDKQLMATADSKGEVYIWHQSGKLIAKLDGHQMQADLKFSPDGKQIATVDGETARIWDLSGKKLAEMKWTGSSSFLDSSFHPKEEFQVKFSSNGQYLMTFFRDRVLRFWDLSNQPFNQQEWPQQYIDRGFSRDGKLLATFDQGTVYIWDLSGQKVAELKGHQHSIDEVKFSPNGQFVATVDRKWEYQGDVGQSPDQETIRLWDLSGKKLVELQVSCNSNCLIFTPNGQQLITKEAEYNREYYKAVHIRDILDSKITEFENVLEVSPDGKYLIKEKNGDLSLWDLSGKQISQISGKTNGGLYEVIFSPNSQQFLIISSHRLTGLWDVSGKQLADFKGESLYKYNNQQIVTSRNEYQAFRVFNWLGQELISFQHPETNKNKSLDVNPKTKIIATQGKEDNIIRLWDLSGNQLGEVKYSSSNSRVQFSPDGKFLITFNEDNKNLLSHFKNNTVRFWDLSGNLISEWNNVVAWRDDWRYIAVNENGKLRMLPISHNLEELLARGCDWLKYYLETHPDDAKQLKVCQIQ